MWLTYIAVLKRSLVWRVTAAQSAVVAAATRNAFCPFEPFNTSYTAVSLFSAFKLTLDQGKS